MKKKIFLCLGIVGIVIIAIIAFTIPKDPYEIIPAMTITSFDKPLWFCIIFGGGFMYLILLFYIYDKLEQIKIA